MTAYAYHVRHKNGWGTGFGPAPTHCHECGAPLPPRNPESCSTGYACGPSESVDSHPDAPELKRGETIERSPAICYTCCAKHDREQMDRDGRAILYLVKRDDGYHVINWPGSLDFKCHHLKVGRHNMAGKRYTAYFTDHNGRAWSGTQYGDNTEIAHCRRLK
jgi:hypothetical protein